MYEYEESNRPGLKEIAMTAFSLCWKGVCGFGRALGDDVAPAIGNVLTAVGTFTLQNLDEVVEEMIDERNSDADPGEAKLYGETEIGGNAIFQNTKTGEFSYGAPMMPNTKSSNWLMS